eukprot:15199-Prymnesium_polylepis.2
MLPEAVHAEHAAVRRRDAGGRHGQAVDDVSRLHAAALVDVEGGGDRLAGGRVERGPAGGGVEDLALDRMVGHDVRRDALAVPERAARPA